MAGPPPGHAAMVESLTLILTRTKPYVRRLASQSPFDRRTLCRVRQRLARQEERIAAMIETFARAESDSLDRVPATAF